MAGRQSSHRPLIAGLTLAVLLLHWLALAWLERPWIEPSVLRALTSPMFTRTLTPSVAAAAPKPASARKARPARPAPATPSEASPIEPLAPLPAEAAIAAAPEPEAVLEEAALAAPTTPPQADAAPADNWPADTRLSYQARGVFRGPLWGDAQVQWQREGERYQVQLKVSFGWMARLSMTSQGRVTPTQLLPETFEEETTTARRHLEFTPQEIVLMNGSRLPRPEGVQDSASQFVALAQRFASAATPMAVGQSVQFWLARPGGADVWTYDVVEMETLATPHLGALQTFHLKPRPLANPRGPITAEMWFAPALQYLPVRIKVTLNDEAWVDLLVDKIEQSAAPGPSAKSPP